VGKSSLLDVLEVKLNRAAEVATPKAKKLFWQAISEMTFEDVKAIYKGPDDAATSYFRKKMSPTLAEEMRPFIRESMSKAGAVQAYDRVMGKYKSLPFVLDVKANLTDYVIEKAWMGSMRKEEVPISGGSSCRTGCREKGSVVNSWNWPLIFPRGTGTGASTFGHSRVSVRQGTCMRKTGSDLLKSTSAPSGEKRLRSSDLSSACK